MAVSRAQSPWLAPLLVAVLWGPPMIAASYEWRAGDYYDYGWFVPPAALLLLIMRWRDFATPPRALPGRLWGIMAVLLLPAWLVLRVLGYADPSWRMPMVLLAALAFLGTHLVLAAARGWRGSASFLWISLLCASAIPWPSVVERHLVSTLTDHVVAATAEILRLYGRPVEVLGDLLELNGTTVEVSDGCSGVRSFQTFFMATWFFAALHRLRPARALLLLSGAFAVAFAVNTARSLALAIIRFDHGQDAFERAHDWLGLAAFVLSATCFYLASGWLARSPIRRRLLRRTVTTAAT